MTPAGATSGAPAEFPPASPAGRGMFGNQGTGDVSGFGGLVRQHRTIEDSPRPYGGYFDEVRDALEEAYPAFGEAIEKVVVDRGELTLHIRPERIAEVCQVMRDDSALRFELCSSVSGVDYLGADERRLHVVYQLTSMTYRRRVRLEAAVSVEQPHLPSVTSVYPTADWQEREAYDMSHTAQGERCLTRH
ncbi:NADH-quinone oxidoreductase subunit C [Micromonospora sp. NPDC051296]|uniref:NADH-quinone oxidoreductase subunit C n=1 Tax=Micromonospora sp. NPDC051296 TaxID=3155046 RepID=UPI00343FAE8D